MKNLIYTLVILTSLLFSTAETYNPNTAFTSLSTPAQWQTVVVTAYCPCHKCCGKSNGVTASGKTATAKHTIAADLSIYPFGTRLYIKGVGIRTVEDTGSKIKDNRLDLFFNTHEEALQFGIQTLYVKELPPCKKNILE